MTADELKPVLEALLMASDQPLAIDRLAKLLEDDAGVVPSRELLADALRALGEDYVGRGIELVEVASGYRFRARAAYAERVGRLWDERKPRYSRALLETLAIIAYRQPITRGEIEHIRGVAVSSNIMRVLLEREWVKVVGQRDVPGRPSVYATTREFLDYFGLKSLEELPPLAELTDLDAITTDLFSAPAGGAGTVTDSDAEAVAALPDDQTAATDNPARAAG
jgi:segregation and condensation protein B